MWIFEIMKPTVVWVGFALSLCIIVLAVLSWMSDRAEERGDAISSEAARNEGFDNDPRQ